MSPTHPHPSSSLASFALSSTLLALSCPSTALCFSSPLHSCLIYALYFFPTTAILTVVVRSVHLLQAQVLLFFLALCSHTTYELKPSCVISRWISLLVALIASAWYEIRHWLHRFEPQSTALLSWIPACNISHRMCTNEKGMCSNI